MRNNNRGDASVFIAGALVLMSLFAVLASYNYSKKQSATQMQAGGVREQVAVKLEELLGRLPDHADLTPLPAVHASGNLTWRVEDLTAATQVAPAADNRLKKITIEANLVNQKTGVVDANRSISMVGFRYDDY